MMIKGKRELTDEDRELVRKLKENRAKDQRKIPASGSFVERMTSASADPKAKDPAEPTDEELRIFQRD